ncbi:hypothetical protein B296_00051294, partial [Ensete ventricosum]
LLIESNPGVIYYSLLLLPEVLQKSQQDEHSAASSSITVNMNSFIDWSTCVVGPNDSFLGSYRCKEIPGGDDYCC